jgi:hypothetical protein
MEVIINGQKTLIGVQCKKTTTVQLNNPNTLGSLDLAKSFITKANKDQNGHFAFPPKDPKQYEGHEQINYERRNF